jgi:hypothetical protein
LLYNLLWPPLTGHKPMPLLLLLLVVLLLCCAAMTCQATA